MLLELQYHLHHFIVLLNAELSFTGKMHFREYFFPILKLGTLKATVDREKMWGDKETEVQ